MGEKDVTNKITFWRELSFIHELVIVCTDYFILITAPIYFFKKKLFTLKK